MHLYFVFQNNILINVLYAYFASLECAIIIHAKIFPKLCMCVCVYTCVFV